ncbi:MAG TPA: SMP-30/gluconolactonase/LRE family protein [Panacibacter sp.]|nr:SMP-30/gluconolactonase/LRE family protein [Panacibacter sp.]HNP45908.1 SMP-30/gluconolactonase/LRE family protein [Panacibacter sp.]
MEAVLLHAAGCLLGEGPMWHKERGSFFWVDIDGKAFYEYNFLTGDVKKRQLNHRVSLVTKYKHFNDRLLLAVQGGLALYDLTTETFTWHADIEKEILMHRTNDGAVDCNGNLWVGTMHRQFVQGAGALYRIDQQLNVEKKLEGVTISNGLVWNYDHTKMYFIDTPLHTVRSFLFDSATGALQFEKNAVEIDKATGSPDGMCIDEEGMLWVAQWNGFGVYRYNPGTGQLLGKISVPVPQVSACAFGGPELDTMIITTAQENFSEEDKIKYPLSGGLFMAKPGVRGFDPERFK